jgi:type II secretory pathway pseudopilin PulG
MQTLDMERLVRRMRRNRRRRTEGMTLVEIMVVVIIMVLIATAVAVIALPRLERAEIERTRTDVMTIEGAVNLYFVENRNADCPSVADLVEGGVLDDDNTRDPWDQEYVIECSGDNVEVTSSGPDRQMGTEDDI